MATPTISSITPNTGHTGGKTLVEIVGTNFALPPPPPAEGPTTAPAPSVAVTIGGRPCPVVWVVSPTLLRALTPIHDPSGIPAVVAEPERSIPAAAAIPASDVVVQNLDATGAPIVGESATLATAYSFVRPDLTVECHLELVIKAFILELERQVIDNVQWNPHTDYDPDTGDALNFCELARLPGIAIVGLKLPKSQWRQDNTIAEVPIDGATFIMRRPPDVRDVAMTLVGASDNSGELTRLLQATEGFFRKNPTLALDRDPADPTKGSIEYQLDRASDDEVSISGTMGSTNVRTFAFSVAIRGVLLEEIPGLPTSSIPGAPADFSAEPTIGIGRTLLYPNVDAQVK